MERRRKKKKKRRRHWSLASLSLSLSLSLFNYQLVVARRFSRFLSLSPNLLSSERPPPELSLTRSILPPPPPRPPRSQTFPPKTRKRNPVARFLARHGASLSLLLLVVLGLGAAAHLRQARSCSQLTQRLHHDITELQNEHGHAVSSSDATAQQAGALQHQLDEARHELAAARAASAERDRRLAEAEAAAHGHAASAHGSSAEVQALRSRADTLALSLAAAERERDEARHLLEAEKALLLRREAEWKAAEAAAHAKGAESYGGHQGDGDNDHTGFLQVAKLLEVSSFSVFSLFFFFCGREREETGGATKTKTKQKNSKPTFSFLSSSNSLPPTKQDQGVTHPQGHRAMASSLARFFEDQMASALASAERGEAMPDVPVHDVSTKLISHLSHAGVASSHGVEHLFQTVDHLVDAALTHWRPPPPGATQPAPHHEEHHDPHAQQQHHEAAAGHHDPHAAAAHHEAAAGHHEAAASHHEEHHDPHAQQYHHEAAHHDPHAAAAHHEQQQQQQHHDAHHDPRAAAHAGGGHVDAHATGDPHHAPAVADAHHHQHHKVDSSGFVM